MSKVRIKDLLEGARLRTLPAAIAPVVAGSGAAMNLGGFSWGKSALALAVAVFLQIGVNLANDYSDGIRGTDRYRVGPKRLTASGLVSAASVLKAALVCFFLAAVCGVVLVFWSGVWWLLLAGCAAILAAWFYTGGRHPYAYMGVGISEIMVFLFFGLLATIGTTLVQTPTIPWWLWVGACGMGLSSIALLTINNLRDMPTDIQAGKITLAVRLGDNGTRGFYVLCMLIATILSTIAVIPVGNWWSFVVGILLFGGVFSSSIPVIMRAHGMQLLRPLRNTGLFTLLTGVLQALVWSIW